MTPPAHQDRWVVVGVDFSATGWRAFEHAVRLAGALRANVVCVHAYEEPIGVHALHDSTLSMKKLLEEAIDTCGTRERGVIVEPVVRRGAAPEKLLNVAAERGAELLVVGAQGRHASPKSMFLGGVASRLVATSTRPVLVVPSDPYALPGRCGPGPTIGALDRR
jgi:nucleotide-binding universal stress UspA family protein